MRRVVIIVLAWAALALPRLGEQDLWASHEARAAQNAAGVLRSGDWSLPRLFDGSPEYQKPPAFYWLVATFGRLTGGVDALAARLPAALSALAAALALLALLSRANRPDAGLLAALILLTTVRFTTASRVGRIDMPLTAATAWAVTLWACGWGVAGRARNWPWLAGGACAGIAVLFKGLVGLAVPLAVGLGWCLASRRRPPIVPALLALATCAAVAGPWFVWAHEQTNGEFTRTFFWYHHVQRATGGAAELASHPLWFYLPRWLVDALPWSPLAVWAVASGEWRRDALARFGLVWLVAVGALLSLSRFKRADYLIPAYPGMAVLLGCWLEPRWGRLAERTRAFVLASSLTAAAVGWWGYDRFLLPPQAAPRECAAFARAIRQESAGPVALFRVESHLLSWHLGTPLSTLTAWADLDAALGRDDRPRIAVLPPHEWAQWPSRLPHRRARVLLSLADTLPVPPARPLIAVISE